MLVAVERQSLAWKLLAAAHSEWVAQVVAAERIPLESGMLSLELAGLAEAEIEVP